MARNNGASVRDGAAAKAEQRKKIIAIGGSVVLVALLAFQIPKTLKRLHPATPAAAPSTSTTAAPGATATGSGTGSSAMPTPAQKRVLAHLKVHDPFAPLIKGTIDGGAPPPGGSSASSSPGTGSGAATPPAQPGTKTKDGAIPTTTTEGPIGFTAPNATPTVPVAPPAAAIIWVNGNRQMVGLKQLFPLKAPAFRLVAIDRKTMQIRVAGGSFTGGHAVITLARGKAVTLVNTTTGVRYVIRFAAPLAALPADTAPKTPASSPTTTTTTTTAKTEKGK